MTPAPPTPGAGAGAEAGRGGGGAGGGGGGGLGGVLGALPGPAREALLRRPEAALAAVRSLPSARARLYALRMAAAGGGGGGGGGGGEGVALTGGLVASWSKPGAGSASGHAAALRALVALGLWARDGPEGGFRVSPAFSAGLRSALEGGADGGSGEGEEEGAVDAAAAAAAGTVPGDGEGCWEVLLLGLVEAGAGEEVSEEPAPEGEAGEGLDERQLFERLGLVGPAGGALTAAGFRFLLQDTHAQMWALLQEYLLSLEEGRAAVTLGFLLQLGFRDLSRPYRLEALEPAQRDAVGPLSRLGLVHTFSADGVVGLPTHVAPTDLARTLCGGGTASTATGKPEGAQTRGSRGGGAAPGLGGGFILVETNFRVYAYTRSRLAGAVLRLFCAEEYLLPNLFVGRLTRESCGAAFALGIGAEAVLAYLRERAHPQARRGAGPAVPGTVADALRLWEAEAQRVSLEEAVLYSHFSSEAEFRAAEGFARSRGALLWSEPAKLRLAALGAFLDEMRAFIRANRAKAPD